MQREKPNSPHKGGLFKEETKRKSYASAIIAFVINAMSFVVLEYSRLGPFCQGTQLRVVRNSKMEETRGRHRQMGGKR
jgi:hypothetical protein